MAQAFVTVAALVSLVLALHRDERQELIDRLRLIESGTLELVGPGHESLLSRLPIVAMTASATLSDRTACLAVGMDDFLPKPWTEQQLADVLARLRGRTHPSTAQPAGCTTSMAG